MRWTDVEAAIAELLSLVDGDARGSPREREARLARCLDVLALEAGGQDGAVELDPDAPEPPSSGGDGAPRERIAARFPRLGLYAAPSLDPGELTVGDAIDDVLDIASELRAVAWLGARGYTDAARRQFAWSYRMHWGEHLRGLQWVLHALADRD